jgi:hypothetical protein
MSSRQYLPQGMNRTTDSSPYQHSCSARYNDGHIRRRSCHSIDNGVNEQVLRSYKYGTLKGRILGYRVSRVVAMLVSDSMVA